MENTQSLFLFTTHRRKVNLECNFSGVCKVSFSPNQASSEADYVTLRINTHDHVQVFEVKCLLSAALT